MKYVIFPGAAGNHISTDDVNLLDADTAHLYQSTGIWNGIRIDLSLVDDGLSPYSGKAIAGTVTDATAAPRFETLFANKIPVMPSTEYSVGASLRQDIGAGGSNWRIRAVFFDDTDEQIGSIYGDIIQVTSDAYNEAFITFVTPDTPAFMQIWMPGDETTIVNGDVIHLASVVLREGSDSTFVPSLNIVGTLEEIIDPTDMPIAYTPGSPLTVGDGWAGNGVSYIRNDGTGGPTVAHFDPEDIVLP